MEQGGVSTKNKAEGDSLYFDHQAGFRRLMRPLKITLTTHHEEKLMPVAGGTRLMALNATGHET